MADSIKELTALVTAWADNHPKLKDRTPESIFMKFFEEIGELIKHPRNPGEHADVAILLFDLASAYSIDLAQAIRDKMAVNAGRDWAITETGTYQHTTGGTVTPIHRPSPPPASGFGEFQDGPMFKSTSTFNRACYEQGGADFRAGVPMLKLVPFIERMNELVSYDSGAFRTALALSTADNQPPTARESYEWYKMGYEKAQGE